MKQLQKIQTDFLIVGGGVIGLSVAREITLRNLGSVTLIDKEQALGLHTSGRNSGVIHSGINQKPGSLKARLALEGSRLLKEYCLSNNVPMNPCGTLVVGRDPDEKRILQQLFDMGRECGVEGLKLLTGNELRQREPDAIGDEALFSPNGATVDPLALVRVLEKEIRGLGVRVELNEKIQEISNQEVRTQRSLHQAAHLINCAGLYADTIAHQCSVGKKYAVIPFRGEYYEIPGANVRSMIYQPPNLKFPFLSIHLTRETDGRVLAGPSAVISCGRESYEKEINFRETFQMVFSSHFLRLLGSKNFIEVALGNFKTSLFKQAFLKEVKGLVRGLDVSRAHPAKAGIRAQLVSKRGELVNDLLVEKGERSTHILNTVSPGMTCSLAFARFVVGTYLLKDNERTLLDSEITGQ